MLSSFASNESIDKIENFSFYNFLEHWKDYFTPEVCQKLDISDINRAFLPNKGQGLFPKEIEEKFGLIRIQEEDVDIYIRSNNTPKISTCLVNHNLTV